MSICNIAHNVGGGLIGPLAIIAIALFAGWESKLYFPGKGRPQKIILLIGANDISRDIPDEVIL